MAKKTASRAERALAAAVEEQRLASLPTDERVRALIAKLGSVTAPITWTVAVERLVAIGRAAVPALVDHLDDAETGWVAAFTLAHLGAPDAAEAAPALWRHASQQPGTHPSMWSTQALARLGMLDEICSLLDANAQQKTFNVAQALAGVAPTSYPWIERALDRPNPDFTAAAADALIPGRSGFFAPPAESFEAALAGTRSPHAMVRTHATLLLLHKVYPKATRPQALAALLRLAGDADDEVRRVTAVTLGRVGKAAVAAALAGLDALRADPSERVRSAAQYSYDQLAKK